MKLLDVVLNIVMVLSAIYAVATMVISFLPVETQTKIFDWLKMSKENIATFSVSSVISSAVLVGSKILQTYSKLNLTNLVNSSQAVINDNLKIDAQCVERVNKMIDNQANVQQTLNTLLEVQKAKVKSNITEELNQTVGGNKQTKVNKDGYVYKNADPKGESSLVRRYSVIL